MENSIECGRKPTAEDFPRNFSLIKLLEKTLERQRKKQEEAKILNASTVSAEQEIAELQKQIAEAEEAKQKALEETKAV